MIFFYSVFNEIDHGIRREIGFKHDTQLLFIFYRISLIRKKVAERNS